MLRRKLKYLEEKRVFALRFGAESQILRMLGDCATRKLIVRSGIHVSVPKTFSVIEDPEVVIDTITQFAAVKMSGVRPSQVYIDQSAMEHYDLAASALLDLVAIELKNELDLYRRPGRFRGRFPKHGPVGRFIRAIGIVKHLGIKDHLPSSQERQRLRVFDRRNRHYRPLKSAKEETPQERAAGKFVEHVNSCLSTQRKQLTSVGETRLSACVGELLDNAEEHGQFPDWSLLGYLDVDQSEPVLDVAIINFGLPIAETFRRLPADHFAWGSIREYVERHEGSKWVGGAQREELITVAALQPHISSKNLDESTDRGHGTVRLLKFFSRMHQACVGSSVGAKMALLSGSTFVRFDGTHLFEDPSDDSAGVWMNQENSPQQRPDRRFVRNLGDLHFPGTIISIRFPLNPAMVEREGSHEQHRGH